LRVSAEESHTKTLGDYLFSRSVAGMNHSELIENIERVSDGVLSGRHFHFKPEMKSSFKLTQRLAKWINNG
jgi:hypothetical protein